MDGFSLLSTPCGRWTGVHRMPQTMRGEGEKSLPPDDERVSEVICHETR